MKLPLSSNSFWRRSVSFVIILSLITGALFWGKSQTNAVNPFSAVPASLTAGASTSYTISLMTQQVIPQFSNMNFGVNGNGPWEQGYAADFSDATFGSISTGTAEFNVNPEYPNGMGLFFNSQIDAGTNLVIVINGVKNPTQSGLYTPNFEVRNQETTILEGFSAAFAIGNMKVRGKILNPEGEGVSWVGVGLSNETQWYNSSTIEDGTFAFFDIPAGTYTLQVFLQPGSLYIAPTLDPVTVGGSLVNMGNITLTIPPKTITGRVLYPDGSPVTDAQVNANRRGAPGWYGDNTDSQGRYSLGVPGGELELMVSPQWGENGQLPVDWAYMGRSMMVSFVNDNSSETQSGVNFRVVNASATVKGKVVKPDGQPLTNGGVDVRSSEGQGSNGSVNQQGNFEINVPPGKYMVNVFAQDQSLASPAIESITIDEDETKNLGTITLIEKTSHIKGKVVDEEGNGIAGVEINSWQPMAGGWSNTQTDNDGRYDLLVAPGDWEINAMPSSELDYAMSGGPSVRVSIAENQTVTGVNFQLQSADATISGTVVDEHGEKLSSLYGFAEARPGVKGEMPLPGLGGSIQNGSFSIKVPAGTYEVSAMFEPGSDYTAEASESVTAVTDETVTVNISVRQNDASISGFLYDEDGNKITGYQAEVFAFNDENAQKMTFVNPEDGSYTLGVLGGSAWFLGVFIDQDSPYVMVPPDDNKTEVAVGGEAVRNFTLLKADATVEGRVFDPDGNPLPNVFVFVDSKAVDDGTVLGASTVRQLEATHQDGLGNVLGVDTESEEDEGPGVHVGNLTDSDGRFSLDVPAGTYGVGSGAPSSMGFISPQIEKVTINSEQTVSDVVLRYKKSDAQITGNIYLDGVKNAGFVWAWSEKGGFSSSFSSNGEFTINVTKDDVWHVGGDYESGQSFYQSDEYIVVVDAATETQDLILQEASFEMPPSVSRTFDSASQMVITLENGMTITVPAGSIATEGNITITITPTARLAKQKNQKPVAFGYEVKAYNSSGQEITTNFNASVTIMIPYTDEMLTEMGITEDDLSASYWDESSNLWQGVSSVVVDKDNNKITLTVDHFTSFAPVTGSADTTPPAAPTGVTVTDSTLGGSLSFSWVNPINTDFAGIKIYRSTVSGTIGELVASVTDGSTSYTDTGLTNGTTYYYILHAVDEVGNESYNTDQYSGIPTLSLSQLPETGSGMQTILGWATALFEKAWNLVGVVY